MLFLGKAAEALAKNLVALHDVHKGIGVDVVKHRAQLNHVGAVKGDIEHLTLIALVKTTAGDERTAALDIVDDVVTDGVRVIGDDKHRLVALHTVNHEVDYLTLDEDDNDGVNGQTDVTKGNQRAQGDNTINNHDKGTQGNLGVLVQNHRDDVRAATGGARAENQTDSNTIDDAGHYCIEEIIGVPNRSASG